MNRPRAANRSAPAEPPTADGCAVGCAHRSPRLAMSKRGRKLKADLGKFLQQYGRRGASPQDANDRHYDRKIEEMIKRMDPVELDRILRDEADDSDE